MLMKLITKRNTKAVLDLIIENDEMYFSELQRALDNVNPGTLNRILKELMDAQILTKRVENENMAMPKTWYRLTDYGKKVIGLYDLEAKLENEAKITNQTNINGKVGKVINVSGDNTTLNIK
ncbi:winged helix-turn-helix transcriptional regulator [Methanococcus maripaludis]|uniref:DNA-binding HxlR family transcriptional regulator n=1 Tax=Methanococcus maripaludis TaxID=39152 RepID=A0A7J9PR64_METMI|nr:helix-turn-helix transcriptional regulator [Methanococcus maripaludis]MBA2863979.1 DNA-binding HxlR family transcriptional regulator [Methanococcus maripaludis]